MRDFFANVRIMLAIDLNNMNLGSIAQEFIKDVIIPRIKKKISSSRDEKEQVKLSSLLELYELYSNPRGREGRLYDKTAVNLVYQISNRWRIPNDDKEDLLQDIAVDFYQPRSALGKDLRGALARFNELDGPLKLNNLWAAVIDRRLQSTLRDMSRQYKEKTLRREVDDEGNETSLFDRIHAPGSVDERHVKELMGGLEKYVISRLKRPQDKEMFLLWYDAVQDHTVNMRREVYPKLNADYGTPLSTLAGWWRDTQKIIIQYFVKELGPGVEQRIKNVMRLGSAEVVTHVAYRQSIARWMLGGLLQAKILGHKSD